MDKNQKVKAKKSIFSSRKFKYGAAATVFTAFFIAAVILFNVIISAIDSKFSLYFDLTDDQIFSISKETDEMVKKQIENYAKEHGEEPQIEIHFFQARDKILEDKEKSWTLNLAESYAEAHSQINVKFHEDLTTHPENYAFYANLGYTINGETILVTNSLQQGSFRYLTFDACMVYDEDDTYVWAYQGEMKLNSAIYYVTQRKSPVVTFITGHGESVPQFLTEMLTNCGFTIENVDLTTQDISEDSKMLFLYAPQKDITYSEDDSVVTEYTKISDYLNAYRSMVVVASPDTPKLPVLDELLESWGLELVRNQVVMDDIYCHTQDKRMLYVNYPESESMAAALTGSLTGLSNPPRTLFYRGAPINILDSGNGTDTIVEPVLTSSDNSYVELITEDGTKKQTGPFNLMAISSRFTYINNAETYGHLLLIGSDSFTETNMFREQFGNTDIVYNIIRLLSNEDVVMETNYKVLEDYTIDIDAGTVYVYGIVASVVIPIAIFAMGTVVYIKRKHM